MTDQSISRKGYLQTMVQVGWNATFLKPVPETLCTKAKNENFLFLDWLIHNKSLTPFEPGQDKFTWDTDCCREGDVAITRSYNNCLIPKEQNLQSGQMHISGTVWTLLGKRQSRCKCVIDSFPDTFYSWWRCSRLCRRRFWSRFSNILALMIL